MTDADGVEELTAWATAHGLTVEDDVRLPRTTPLLAEGEVHSVDALAGGWLSKYVEAKIALVSRGDDEHFTVAVTHVPKAKRFVPWLLCRRVEEGVVGRAAEELIRGRDRLDLESAELDSRYRIYVSPRADQVWVRELLSPRFIVFLLEQAPRGLSFEYVEGTLCVSLVGRRTLGEDLDDLRDATVDLVGRFRAEIRESLGEERGRAAPAPPPFPDG